jgi:tetratricopeptide (TPR) repeat protein
MSSQNSLEKLAVQAHQSYTEKKYKKAADLFETLVKEYQTNGDPLASAEMANNLSVTFLMLGKARQAFEAAFHTEKIFKENKDPSRAAMALGNQAAALEELKKYKDALGLYTESADLLRNTNENEMRSLVLKRISALQIRTGKKLDATTSMYAALQDQEKLTSKEKTLKGLLDTLFSLIGFKNK